MFSGREIHEEARDELKVHIQHCNGKKMSKKKFPLYTLMLEKRSCNVSGFMMRRAMKYFSRNINQPASGQRCVRHLAEIEAGSLKKKD